LLATYVAAELAPCPSIRLTSRNEANHVTVRRRFPALLAALLLFLLTGPALEVASEQSQATPTAEQTYFDPAGQFTIPVPVNWTVEEKKASHYLPIQTAN
jgi:hypothetical protein